MCNETGEFSEKEMDVINTGSPIDTFYYAYCDTEKKRIGNATNQRIIAENSARYHAENNPGHQTSVESDKNFSVESLDAFCSGNGCAHIMSEVLEGPSIRLRNNHPTNKIIVTVFWATILGEAASNYSLFPGDDRIFNGPPPPYIGVSRIKARIV